MKSLRILLLRTYSVLRLGCEASFVAHLSAMGADLVVVGGVRLQVVEADGVALGTALLVSNPVTFDTAAFQPNVAGSFLVRLPVDGRRITARVDRGRADNIDGIRQIFFAGRIGGWILSCILRDGPRGNRGSSDDQHQCLAHTFLHTNTGARGLFTISLSEMRRGGRGWLR